ncbi:MAG: LuxR C-terminal-related transcriptional regulator [Gammaproteobacteria bacterium]
MVKKNKLQEIVVNIPLNVCTTDLDSNIIVANDIAANLMGFNSSDQTVDKTYENMSCDLAEMSEVFKKQDALVLMRKETTTILSYLCYPDDEWKLVLGTKSPIYDDTGHLMGLMAVWQDCTHKSLIDLVPGLLSGEKRLLDRSHAYQFSYVVDDKAYEDSLTERQLECVFYLLRGKTAKEIGDFLCLSDRAIESHIENLKDKFNCSKKPDLINRLLEKGYLQYFPSSLFKLLQKGKKIL